MGIRKIKSSFISGAVLLCFFIFALLNVQAQAYSQKGEACTNDGACDLGLFCDKTKGNTCQDGIAGTDCSQDAQVCKDPLICGSDGKCGTNVHTCISGHYTGTSASCGSTLQRGSRCDQVCALQQALSDKGFTLAIDGEYGPETADAVEKYQQTKNLAVDGIAGPNTLSSLGLSGGTPPAGGGTPPAGAGGPGSAQCGGDNRLEYKNGLCLPKSNFDTKSIAGSSKLIDVLFTVIQYLLILSGLVAVGALVIGGFWYITAAGNEEQSEKGKKSIVSAIIGLVVVILAYAIVNVITSALTTTDILKKTGT